MCLLSSRILQNEKKTRVSFFYPQSKASITKMCAFPQMKRMHLQILGLVPNWKHVRPYLVRFSSLKNLNSISLKCIFKFPDFLSWVNRSISRFFGAHISNRSALSPNESFGGVTSNVNCISEFLESEFFFKFSSWWKHRISMSKFPNKSTFHMSASFSNFKTAQSASWSQVLLNKHISKTLCLVWDHI